MFKHPKHPPSYGLANTVYTCDVVDVCTAVSGSAASELDNQLELKQRSFVDDAITATGKREKRAAKKKKKTSFFLG